MLFRNGMIPCFFCNSVIWPDFQNVFIKDGLGCFKDHDGTGELNRIQSFKQASGTT